MGAGAPPVPPPRPPLLVSPPQLCAAGQFRGTFVVQKCSAVIDSMELQLCPTRPRRGRVRARRGGGFARNGDLLHASKHPLRVLVCLTILYIFCVPSEPQFS